jgi:hypothetical protein
MEKDGRSIYSSSTAPEHALRHGQERAERREKGRSHTGKKRREREGLWQC